MRVDELRQLAVSLGIGNTSTMRKGILVDAIDEQYDNPTETDRAAEAPVDAAPEEQAPAAPEAETTPVEDDEVEAGADAASDAAAPVADAPLEVPVAIDLVGATMAEPASTDLLEPAAEQPSTDEPAADATASAEPATEAGSGVTQAEPVEPETAREADGADEEASADRRGTTQPKSAAAHVNAGLTGIAEDLQALQSREGDEPAAEAEEQPAEGERPAGRRGRGRGRGRGGQNAQQSAEQAPKTDGEQPGAEQQVKTDASAKAEQAQSAKENGQTGQRDQQQNGQPQEGEGRRGRYRDRKRRGGSTDWDEPEVRDDDVLIPIAGILDVLDNYAFVRTSGYLAGTNDVYVSLGQVKKYHLRRGDAVVGAIRQIPDSEQPTRQKYNALVKVDSINGLPVAEAEGRLEFEKLTPLYPAERLRLETEQSRLTARVIDLVAPLGKGQRGLVVAPPRAGTTLLMQAVANAITKNNPEVHLMVVLVDERPEDVTEMQRTVKGEVIASTFDRPAEDQTTVADLAVERAKRLVELGYDVVILLDSITRLGRAYNQTAHQSGRMLAGGIDAAALQPAKQFFGAARNIENGGSLTILASAHIETGSAADEAILAEFVGAANSEIVLSGALADKRIFPAIDITRSGTRREEMLMGPDEVKVTWQLRRAIANHTPQEALDVVTSKLRDTTTNVEFLVQMQKSLPSAK